MTPDDRPNFLWICTDQQRHDTIAALSNIGFLESQRRGNVPIPISVPREYLDE